MTTTTDYLSRACALQRAIDAPANSTIAPVRLANRRAIRSMLRRGRAAIESGLCWTANQHMRAARRWIVDAGDLTHTDRMRLHRAWRAVAATAPASWGTAHE